MEEKAGSNQSSLDSMEKRKISYPNWESNLDSLGIQLTA
jgi:hypothetical protein